MLIKTTNKQASYQETREALQSMQKNCGGAVITPLALHKCFRLIFSEYLNDLDTIRNIAETYCALCNEYFLVGCREKKEIDRICVHSSLHKKYCISKKVWDYCLAKLANADIIHYGYANDKYGENTDIICAFNFDKLQMIKQLAVEIRKEERAKPYSMTDEDFWAQLNNSFNNK